MAVVISGCGGGSDDSSTSSTGEITTSASRPSPQNTAASQGEKGKQDKGRSGGSSAKSDSQKQGNKDDSSSKPSPNRTQAPRISSAPTPGSRKPAPGVKTTKNGDNSVQEYGVESDATERREAAIALQVYLNARAEGNWSRACSLLARKPTEQLERLAGKKADCAEILKATGKEAFSQPGSVITEVLSFRGGGDISGDPSYLIFEGPPERTLFSMPMYLEGGAWKVGLAQPSELPV